MQKIESGVCNLYNNNKNKLLLVVVVVVVGMDSSVDTATLYGLDGRGSNAGGCEIFRSRPDRSRVPPSLLYNEHRVSFPRVKRPGRGVNHPPHLAPKLKKELHFHSTSGPSGPVLRRILPSFTTTTTTTTTTTYLVIFPLVSFFPSRTSGYPHRSGFKFQTEVLSV